MEASTQFPYKINGVVEQDIATVFFSSTSDFDTSTLLKLRLVCKGFRDGIDSNTTLWSRVSLMKAAEENRLDICKLVVRNAEDKNPADQFGITLLHYATMFGHLDIVQFIIERLDDPNPAWHDGYTPLHDAAMFGHLDIARLIIERLDDPNPANQDGVTPLMLAQQYGHQEVCQLIKNAIAGSKIFAHNNFQANWATPIPSQAHSSPKKSRVKSMFLFLVLLRGLNWAGMCGTLWDMFL